MKTQREDSCLGTRKQALTRLQICHDNLRDHLARSIYVKFWHKTEATTWWIDWECQLFPVTDFRKSCCWQMEECTYGGFYNFMHCNSSPGTFCNSFKGRDPGTGASGLVFQDFSYLNTRGESNPMPRGESNPMPRGESNPMPRGESNPMPRGESNPMPQ
uniref:Uncharacterized protein n=1 Tax=Moschus moschiferus TaxID=68415 RepID=A0A8C6DBA6_MOSMO